MATQNVGFVEPLELLKRPVLISPSPDHDSPPKNDKINNQTLISPVARNTRPGHSVITASGVGEDHQISVPLDDNILESLP